MITVIHCVLGSTLREKNCNKQHKSAILILLSQSEKPEGILVRILVIRWEFVIFF